MARLFRERPGKQPGPVGQGTRATVQEGHLNGPKDPPTRTQFGDAGSTPNTQFLPRWWPHNPARRSESANGSRSEQFDTSYELQVQHAPSRILRQVFDRMRGTIGDNFQATFPLTADFTMIPHQFIPRSPRGAGPGPRMSDDNAPIPAVYAGNPRIR